MLSFVPQILLECSHEVGDVRWGWRVEMYELLERGSDSRASWVGILSQVRWGLGSQCPRQVQWTRHVYPLVQFPVWVRASPGCKRGEGLSNNMNLKSWQDAWHLWFCQQGQVFLVFKIQLDEKKGHLSSSDLYATLFWGTHRHGLVMSRYLLPFYSGQSSRSSSRTPYWCQYQAVSVWCKRLW